MRHSVSRLGLALFALALAFPGYVPAKDLAPVRVLFVGNSLTYVGNLPAVLEALSAANGKRISTDMLVKGGATLADRASDFSVQRELASRKYDFVVLQERGGDVFCFEAGTPDGDACQSFRAHVELGRVVVAHGAKPILLGTYQQLEAASRAIEQKERALARQIHAIHVPVSETLRLSQAGFADKDWFNADKMHPGPDLVLLEAVWLYRAIFGSPPAPHALAVAAPIYGPSARFVGSTPASSQKLSAPAARHAYPKQRVADVVRIGTTSAVVVEAEPSG